MMPKNPAKRWQGVLARGSTLTNRLAQLIGVQMIVARGEVCHLQQSRRAEDAVPRGSIPLVGTQGLQERNRLAAFIPECSERRVAVLPGQIAFTRSGRRFRLRDERVILGCDPL